MIEDYRRKPITEQVFHDSKDLRELYRHAWNSKTDDKDSTTISETDLLSTDPSFTMMDMELNDPYELDTDQVYMSSNELDHDYSECEQPVDKDFDFNEDKPWDPETD